VTVLSRCQRFDLRRIEADRLAAHFAQIAAAEGATVEAGALGLIARAADGSVRDGLSLLDQAISHAAGALVTEAAVRDMLGLADRARVFDLFEAVLSGDIAGALDQIESQYRAGADPVVVVQDLLELCHWLTKLKLVPDAADDPGLPETERVRGKALAERLGIAELTRSWQILLKGLQETQTAPVPLKAAEMLLVRLAYAADLPSPADLVRRLERAGAGAGNGERARPAATAAATPPAMISTTPSSSGGRAHALRAAEPAAQPAVESVAAPAPRPAPRPALDQTAMPTSFQAAVKLFAEHREMRLYAHLVNDVHLVHFHPGQIGFRAGANAPESLAADIGRCLGQWTGQRWLVALSNDQGQPSLAEQARTADDARRERVRREPLVRALIEAFPGAEIAAVRAPAAAAARRQPGDDDASGDQQR